MSSTYEDRIRLESLRSNTRCRAESARAPFDVRAAAGNMAIQRQLNTPMLQRQSVGQNPLQNQGQSQQAAVQSPGLGPAITQSVDAMIKANDFQGAVNAIVTKKSADGQLNVTQLAGRMMTYDPQVTWADGSTSMPSWDHINDRADPARVRIGPSAFSSVAYLYSVIMHEYQHVLYQQSSSNQQVSHTAHAQGFESPDEVRAGSWELIHGADTGISKMPDKVAQIWNNLNTSFWKLASNDQPGERALVTQAYQKAREFTRGTGTTLVPFSDPALNP